MPKNNHAIDKRECRQIRKDLEKYGYRSRKQPGSGNRDISLQHDVCWLDSPVGEILIEDKYRENCMWKTLEGWKEGADILTVRQARGERMVFMSWELFLDLVGEHQSFDATKQSGMAVGPPLGVDLHTSPQIPKPKRKIQSRGFEKAKRPMRRA